MSSEKKVNEIEKKLGFLCYNYGVKRIRSAYHIKPVIYSREAIRNFVAETSKLPKDKIYLHDEKYYLTSWDILEDFIWRDGLDLINYLDDVRDCDNFAFAMSSIISMMLGINSFGRASGYVYGATTGNKLGAHAFNMPLTIDNGTLHLRLFEPMTDGSCLANQPHNNVIGPWRYEVTRTRFF